MFSVEIKVTILLISVASQLNPTETMKTARSSISDWALERLMDRQRLPSNLRNSLRPLLSNEIPQVSSNKEHRQEATANIFDASQRVPSMQMLPYPTYSIPPQTSFSCSDVKQAGFYADTETGCQVIRRCTLSNFMFTYICPHRTLFNQLTQSCDYWYNVQCPRHLQQMDDAPVISSLSQDIRGTQQSFPATTNQHKLSIVDRSISVLQPMDSSSHETRSFLDSANDVIHPQYFPTKQLPISQPQVAQSSSIRTLMQWVGENPVWVPRADQLRYQPQQWNKDRKSASGIDTSTFTDPSERMNREQLLFMMGGARTDATTTVVRPSQKVKTVAQKFSTMTTPKLILVTPAPTPKQTPFGPFKNKQLGTDWIPLTEFG